MSSLAQGTVVPTWQHPKSSELDDVKPERP